MMNALIKKDLRLLRVYIRVGVIAMVAAYGLTAVAVLWIVHSINPEASSPIGQAFLILKGSSVLGMALTIFVAALIAGSVFSLERADRSAEFLECLPPSRWQNLVSKFTVVFSVVSLHLLINLGAAFTAWALLPYVHATSLPTELDLGSYVAMGITVFSVTGGSLAASALLRSNGLPILCGLLSPALCLSLTAFLTWAMDLPMEKNAFGVRFAATLALFGGVTTICAAVWYVSRSEP